MTDAKIQRYYPDSCIDENFNLTANCFPDKNGQWVKYEDYLHISERMLRRVSDACDREVEKIRKRIEVLEAENKRLMRAARRYVSAFDTFVQGVDLSSADCGTHAHCLKLLRDALNASGPEEKLSDVLPKELHACSTGDCDHYRQEEYDAQLVRDYPEDAPGDGE